MLNLKHEATHRRKRTSVAPISSRRVASEHVLYRRRGNVLLISYGKDTQVVSKNERLQHFLDDQYSDVCFSKTEREWVRVFKRKATMEEWKNENYTWLERLEDSLFATMDEMERRLALFNLVLSLLWHETRNVAENPMPLMPTYCTLIQKHGRKFLKHAQKRSKGPGCSNARYANLMKWENETTVLYPVGNERERRRRLVPKSERSSKEYNNLSVSIVYF